jgi:hypothetical protein
MCEHRKSAITDELLAVVEAEHDRYRTRRERRPVSAIDS